MSAAQNPHFVTIEEFDRIAANEEDVDLELFEGEVLEVTFPDWIHTLIQRRCAQLLEVVSKDMGLVVVEAPFEISEILRPVKRWADVAFIKNNRLTGALQQRVLTGPPDLVIEVLSPSNSASKLNRLERLCLTNGCQEFWVVDPDDRSVRVSRGNVTTVYLSGDSVPLPMFNADPLPVDRVFEGILI